MTVARQSAEGGSPFPGVFHNHARTFHRTTFADRRTAPSAFDRAAFEAFLKPRNEPGWITDARRKAFDIYSQKLDAPLDPEEFKRVDLRAFRPDDYRLIPSTATAASAEFATLLADRAEFRRRSGPRERAGDAGHA